MMDKRAEVSAKMAIAKALLGKTTGASKGSPAPQPAKVKVRPMGGIKNLTEGPQGFKATWTKTF